jgi:hypothetical protein
MLHVYIHFLKKAAEVSEYKLLQTGIFVKHGAYPLA